ncbi:MAG: anaerobic ribonucleoside-triphosphate reductase activating protein [Oscillospiraceae bacterium]|nr:anaerobic ribonucleoside-triphosphate reductase activating protein [Oscillospiraceae bacterium]
MNYATIKFHDIANGPGVRVSLFVSGCTHHCKGCFNPETWDFDYGQPYTEEVMETILDACDHPYIRGLSLLGGEPFEPQNQQALLPLLEKFHQRYPEKNVWCYSGYDYERDMLSGRLGNWNETKKMLSLIDILVDGEFHLKEKNLSLRFRGSSNQRIIDVPKSLETDSVVLWDEASQR